MVAKCQVVLTRNKLNAQQYQPDESVIIPNSENTDEDNSRFLNQLVKLLVLIYKDTDMANCTEQL